jgi:hypothetical protein
MEVVGKTTITLVAANIIADTLVTAEINHRSTVVIHSGFSLHILLNNFDSCLGQSIGN